MCQTVILLTATLALLSGQAIAQSVPQNCSAVTGIDWKNETLVGNWLELARNPGNNTNACLEFRTSLLANGSLSINATHSSSPTSTYQNVDQPQVIVNLNGSTTGYNVSLTEGQLVHINLLEVVNNATYILGCGYTNATDNSTSFGFILGRADKYNATGLKLANDEAALKYSNFNSSYATILQQGCTRNSASQSLPLISGFVALALLLIKAH